MSATDGAVNVFTPSSSRRWLPGPAELKDDRTGILTARYMKIDLRKLIIAPFAGRNSRVSLNRATAQICLPQPVLPVSSSLEPSLAQSESHTSSVFYGSS